MPSAIPAYPSPAYNVATTRPTSTGLAPEAEIPEATSDHTDEFGDVFLAALNGTNAPIDDVPAGPDERDPSLASQQLAPAEEVPFGQEPAPHVQTRSQNISPPNVPVIVSMDEYGRAPTSGDPRENFDPTRIDDVNGTIGGDQPSYAAYVAEAPVVVAATKPVVEPSHAGESRFVTAAQDRVASPSRFGSEFFAAPASSSEVLGVRSGIPLPNDAPDSHATMETPVSAAPAPIMLATESSALSSGRDRPSAIQEGEPVADERNLRSELDAPALEPNHALDRKPLDDFANPSARRRTSTSSDMAPENGPSKVSRPAAAAVFNVRTGETTDADDVTPRAVGQAGPRDHHAELPVDSLFGMQLAAEDVGGQAAAFSESHADVAPQPIARQLAPSLVSHAELSTKGTATQFEMHLDPPELGRVTVHLRQSEAGLRAHIVVAREATVPVLERELPILQATLENAGVTVEGFDVSHHHGGGHFEDDREVLFPVDDEDSKTRSVRAMARPTAGTNWVGAGRVDLQA